MRTVVRRGYALPVVLAAVAVLSLVFASAASAVAALGAAARGAVDGAAFQAVAMSLEARALDLAATSRFAPDGLQAAGPPPAAAAPQPRSRVRLDGRPYVADADPALRLSLQDEAGLMNLDASRPDSLLRLFARLGLTAGEAETLRDRLLDALDAKSDRRPRGAKAADYAAAGLPTPRSGGFDGLAEAAGVLGWPSLITGPRRRAVEAWATAIPGATAFNVNTAPIPVLAMVLNLSDEAAGRIVARREAGPVTSLAQIGLPAAGGPGGEPVRPNGRVRLTVEDARRGLRYISHLSPVDVPFGPPWLATSAVLVRTDPSSPPADAPRLPDPSGSAPAR